VDPDRANPNAIDLDFLSKTGEKISILNGIYKKALGMKIIFPLSKKNQNIIYFYRKTYSNEKRRVFT
jgi:hypothetical protein